LRTGTVLLGLLLVAWCGCTMQDTYPKSASHTEVVTLNIPFQENYPDTSGAKRVVVCQFNDDRTAAQMASIGEGTTEGAPRRFVVRQDLTQVLPRILGGYLHQTGFNVVYDEKLMDAGGDAVREVLKRNKADYLIAGNLQELMCRARMDVGRQGLVMVKSRLDVYNNEGRLRGYYNASDMKGEPLGEKADDPAELSTFVETSIRDMFARAFEDDGFVRWLDLNPDTVQELMKAKPVPSEEAVPSGETKTEPVPATPEPKKAMTEEEKRLEMEKDLENAVKEPPAPKTP